ncbi:MAG: aminotransferase class V-fold PLP-dependent enzyme [Gemmatimonadota bacterium]
MNDTDCPPADATGVPPSPAASPADPLPSDSLLAYREEFPILRSKAYLNSNSLGALSLRSVRERATFEEQWNELGAAAWYELWMSKLEAVRDGFGRGVGAAARDIALMPSVSAGLAAVAGALEFQKRNRIVITELDFPTLGHQFLSRRRLGLEVEIVRSPDGVEVPLEAVEKAVDDRTALLATSHVFFTSGAIQDAAALAEIAHRSGAYFLLDAYQSNGQLPISVEECEADFLVSGCLKWLLGGPGLAFLYVRPEIDVQPTTLSWFGVRDQFSFDLEGAVPRDDARRFELGTPAVGAAFTAAGGLEVIHEVGIPAIRRRNAGLAEDLIERLRERGFGVQVAPTPERRSALVLVPHPDASTAVQRLAARGIVADHRAGCVRFSPHFYNTVEDGERAVAALAETRLPAAGSS